LPELEVRGCHIKGKSIVCSLKGFCIFAFICEINAFRVDGTGLAEFLSGFGEIEGKMTRRARAKISRAIRNPAITYSRDFVADTSSTVYPLLELKNTGGKVRSVF
jgi:hypothetical protein